MLCLKGVHVTSIHWNKLHVFYIIQVTSLLLHFMKLLWFFAIILKVQWFYKCVWNDIRWWCSVKRRISIRAMHFHSPSQKKQSKNHGCLFSLYVYCMHAWCHLKFQKQDSTGRPKQSWMNKVGTRILREGSSLILAMKTETCLTQPKWPTHCNFNPASPHPSWSQYTSDIHFYHVSFFLNFCRLHAMLTYHLKGCVGKSPTIWPLISSPILLLLKEAASNLLGESCCLSDVTLSLFHGTHHYFVHAMCQEDINVFWGTLKAMCLLLYWGKVLSCATSFWTLIACFACMYDSLNLVSTSGLIAIQLQ